MKKFIALITLLMLVFSLAACSKSKCDICDEEISGKKYEKEIDGEEYTVCKECYETNDCDVCGEEGAGKHKVTEDGETAYLCNDCNELYELGKSMGF